MKALRVRFAHNKYRLSIFGLLAGASIICTALVRFRATLTGSVHNAFLIWNLFLFASMFTSFFIFVYLLLYVLCSLLLERQVGNQAIKPASK